MFDFISLLSAGVIGLVWADTVNDITLREALVPERLPVKRIDRDRLQVFRHKPRERIRQPIIVLKPKPLDPERSLRSLRQGDALAVLLDGSIRSR